MKMLLILFITFSFLHPCSLEEIIQKNLGEHVDPDIKSIKGWIRVFSKHERLKTFGISIDEKERKYIITKLTQCLDKNSIGRI